MKNPRWLVPAIQGLWTRCSFLFSRIRDSYVLTGLFALTIQPAYAIHVHTPDYDFDISESWYQVQAPNPMQTLFLTFSGKNDPPSILVFRIEERQIESGSRLNFLAESVKRQDPSMKPVILEAGVQGEKPRISYFVDYTTQKKGRQFKQRASMFVRRQRVYIVTLSTPLELFDEYLKQYQAVIQSFRSREELQYEKAKAKQLRGLASEEDSAN